MPIDYKDYHPKWTLIVRMIKRRDGHMCKWCGAKNYLPHPITQSLVVLTVAHLDRDRNNNQFSNLAALCQRCHLNHDRAQHIFNRRYGRQTKYLNGKLFGILLLVSCHIHVTMHVSKELAKTTGPNEASCSHQNAPYGAPTPQKMADHPSVGGLRGAQK